jgi:hypothetical protein
MIRLQRSMVEGLTGPKPDPQAVRKSLQSAIELEHSTIPLYLYALYSLDPVLNGPIQSIVASVVIEEMLHMTLAANVLNAIGGNPVIDSPDFVPTYPGNLPGSVDSSLIVSLAPFSMTQLTAFLEIEEPADPLPLGPAPPSEGITIGQFYNAISGAIAALSPGIFVPPPRNQVGPDLMDQAVIVTDLATAQQAIQTIIDQGEGTSKSPLEVVGNGYAHYYRYMQVQEGAKLIQLPNGQYSYTGAAIPFNPGGVYGVPTNPGPYPPGSKSAFANDNFNYAYTSLLKCLHAMFNGDATEARMNTALGLMMSLKGQAKAMMSGIPDPGTVTGPTFEYQPVNPPPR